MRDYIDARYAQDAYAMKRFAAAFAADAIYAMLMLFQRYKGATSYACYVSLR